ncbi:hypothetical protein DMUE_5535, partial [Dictyocoela muelleri]
MEGTDVIHTHTKPNSLKSNELSVDSSLFYRIQKQLQENYSKFRNLEFKERTYCFKIPNIRIKHNLIKIINICSGQLTKDKNLDLRELNALIYSAQLTYSQISHKNFRIADDRILQIEKKIEYLKKQIEVLTKKKNNEKINETDKKQITYILRKKMKVITNTEIVLIIQEKETEIQLLKDKQEKIRNRKNFNQCNTLFEINRGAFYRGL